MAQLSKFHTWFIFGLGTTFFQWDFQGPLIMGIVWEACHKGVPLLGVPGITLDFLDVVFLPMLWNSTCHLP